MAHYEFPGTIRPEKGDLMRLKKRGRRSHHEATGRAVVEVPLTFDPTPPQAVLGGQTRWGFPHRLEVKLGRVLINGVHQHPFPAPF